MSKVNRDYVMNNRIFILRADNMSSIFADSLKNLDVFVDKANKLRLAMEEVFIQIGLYINKFSQTTELFTLNEEVRNLNQGRGWA